MRVKSIILCSLLGMILGPFIFGTMIAVGSKLPYEAGSVIELTNQERSGAGQKPLEKDERLMKAAQQKAEDMAAKSYFSHQSPSGWDPKDWIESSGYVWKRCGENTAFNYETPEELLAGWMSSAGHRANILSQRFEEIGVGLAVGDYNGKTGIFAVQMFASPYGEFISESHPEIGISTSTLEIDVPVPELENSIFQNPVSSPAQSASSHLKMGSVLPGQASSGNKPWYRKYWTETETECQIMFYLLPDRCLYPA